VGGGGGKEQIGGASAPDLPVATWLVANRAV